jgi:branched-chain amino acid transport system ATP-binding protein
MVQRVAETLLLLKSEGLGMLLIEQKLDIALELADDVLVLGRGDVVFFGSVAQLRTQSELIETWVGVA